jgi:hypothetical protein
MSKILFILSQILNNFPIIPSHTTNYISFYKFTF